MQLMVGNLNEGKELKFFGISDQMDRMEREGWGLNQKNKNEILKRMMQ